MVGIHKGRVSTQCRKFKKQTEVQLTSRDKVGKKLIVWNLRRGSDLAERRYGIGSPQKLPVCIFPNRFGEGALCRWSQARAGKDLLISQCLPAEPQKTGWSGQKEISCCQSMETHLALPLGGSCSGECCCQDILGQKVTCQQCCLHWCPAACAMALGLSVGKQGVGKRFLGMGLHLQWGRKT